MSGIGEPVALWLRVGEALEEFGQDLDALLDTLREYGLGQVLRWQHGEWEGPVMERSGAVSIYWADPSGLFVRGLRPDERCIVEEYLNT